MSFSGHNANITAAFIENTVVIRVEGRGSFKISPPLKQFVHRVINERSAKEIRIDMSSCTGMDSTFMGVLAGLSCFLKKNSPIKLSLFNLSEKNEKLLITLGVDKVLDYVMAASESRNSDSPPRFTETLDPSFSTMLEAAQTSLDAHQTLVNINPDNYDKFKSVLEYLRDDVKKLG